MADTPESRPVALLTGAAGGLGGAIAHALAARGFDLVLSDIPEPDRLPEASEEQPRLDALCDEVRKLGCRAASIHQDITRTEQLAGFVQHAHAAFGRLDCLVNNAGVSVFSRGDILDVTPESFDRCMAVNLRAQFFLTQAVARRMLKDPRPEEAAGGKRRSIITVSTVAVDGIIAKVLAEYSISKAGLSHAIKHFAVRLVTEGIDCYEIRPGMMKTNMTETSQEKYDALIASGFVPAHRWGELSDIGETIANVAGGALRYAVGQTLNIDGGLALKTF
jgi:NAD(P)-dependent dehydrogenase (short-subunit alcohol dehydrogenase family)